MRRIKDGDQPDAECHGGNSDCGNGSNSRSRVVLANAPHASRLLAAERLAMAMSEDHLLSYFWTPPHPMQIIVWVILVICLVLILSPIAGVRGLP